MAAAFPHTTLRWILRCLLAFCLSTPITSAISPVRWDYPSTLGLARYHGLSILKYSSHTTSSVRSSDTSAEPFTASDDRTSIVTAFLRMGYARFSLLNGGTTESVVGTSTDFFSARLLRDLGLYCQINSVEFQLFDANAEMIAMSAESLISQSPFRFGSVPTAIPRLLARVPSAQLHFLSEALGHPSIADGCPPVPVENGVFTPLDPAGLKQYSVPAGLPFSGYNDEESVVKYANGLLKEDLVDSIKKHFPESAFDEGTKKADLAAAFVKLVMDQRAAGAEDLAVASGVVRTSRSDRPSGSATAANVVSLQNSLSEIRAIAGPLVLADSCYLSAGLLGPLAVQTLCTIVTGQLALYRTVYSRVNAGSALPHNERFFRALVVEFRSSLETYQASAMEKAIGYVPIGTISFMCLLQALQLRSGASSAQQALEGLRHVDLHLGQKGFSLTPLYSYLKSCEATLAKSGSPAIDPGQLAEALFYLHDAPLRNWLAVRSEIPQNLSLALSAVHVKVMKHEKVLDVDVKGLMDALALETRFVDLCALQDDAVGSGGLIAGVGMQMPALPASKSSGDTNKSGGICLNFLRRGGCRRKNCHLGHYDSGNPVPKSSLETEYKNLAKYQLSDPGDLDESKIRAGGMNASVLRAALRPVGSPRVDRPKKGKKDDAALIAAVREVLTGVSAPPVVAGAVPAALVQATAFSLLPAPPPAPSADVAAAISTISSQVTEQQRTTFLSLSDKEFRDHFAKTFGL